MSATLPRPLLKLFAPRPPLDYQPPLSSLRRNFGFGGVHPFLEDIKKLIRNENAMKLDVARTKSESYVDRIREEYELRQRSGDEKKTKNPFATLFVGRLPADVDEQEIIQLGESFGNIISMKMVLKKRARYAFIEFENDSDVKKALRGFPRILRSKRIVVDVEKGRTYKQFIPNKYKSLRR